MASAKSSQLTKGYNSFSGVDIRAVFGNVVIGNLQAISYSITREKAPLYTMGSADPRSFSRGKRGIAGTLIFLVFDRHPLLGTFGVEADVATQLKFQSDIDDMRPDAFNTTTGATISAIGPGSTNSVVNTADAQETQIGNSNSFFDDQVVAIPWYADQIPPFDVTLAAANEYGSLAVMRIYGIEILNEGYGVSIDDMVSEQQHTYVARTLSGWKPVANESVKNQIAGSVT